MNVNLNSNELFCHKYWKNILHKTKNINRDNSISEEFKLPEVNSFLLGEGIAYRFDKPVNKIIAQTDLEFKHIKASKKKQILWRGINHPGEYDNKVLKKRFERCANLKNGDILYMPEYAYAAEEYAKFYSEIFAGENGILYKIEVPKGAKLPYKSIFPRASKFKCVGNTIINTEEKHYRQINLIYILKDEKTGFFNKLKNAVMKLFK